MKSPETDVRYLINPHNGIICEGGRKGFTASARTIKESSRFHEALPGYGRTPLHELKSFASKLGVRQVLVKDESKRFGLKAFKALGASYAIAKIMSQRLCHSESIMGLNEISSKVLNNRIEPMTFVTATDGNHGRAVAWFARMLGMRAAVFMPKGSASSRVEAIRDEGAEVYVTESSYDDAVRLASGYAERQGGILVQDTAWEGYEEVPQLIMQGYLTLLSEVQSQIRSAGGNMPTHVILQAGVGSFAASMLAGFETFGVERMPYSIIVEPKSAACMYESASSPDGRPVRAQGDLDTIMAGLACGEPNPIAWRTIKRLANAFVCCDDVISEEGMGILAHPEAGDAVVVSGESGAVGAGLLKRIMNDGSLRGLKEAIRLGADSAVLLISTEGDTDPVGYSRVIASHQA